MAPSPAQLAANAANAQLSTGPRTPEGKARSSENARTHGLTARDLIVLPEEREEFEELQQGLRDDIRPCGALQEEFFRQLVAAAWNMRRIGRLEATLCGAASYQEQLANDQMQASLERLARHYARFERTYNRSFKELKTLQNNTVITATLPRAISAQMPALASPNEIAKRSHQFPVSDSRVFAARLNPLSKPVGTAETTVPASQPASSASTA